MQKQRNEREEMPLRVYRLVMRILKTSEERNMTVNREILGELRMPCRRSVCIT
jgi:hypothetical protein